MDRMFVGRKTMRGSGLGGFFSSLFRRIIPYIKTGGKYLATAAAQTGVNTARDIIGGANPRQALKRRIADTSDRMLDEVKAKIRRKMTGRGLKKRLKKRFTAKKKNKKKKKPALCRKISRKKMSTLKKKIKIKKKCRKIKDIFQF